MAEHVQATLDRMVSDLVLFQKDSPFSTLLSPAELQSIIEQRRSNEYLLRRRNPRCSDFLNYIQYETQLYQLLQLRFNKHMQVEQTSSRASHKTLRKEYRQKVVRPILQHIHLLYIRTLRRYKHQYILFQQYADFCRQVSSYARLHACYQDALKYHAHNLQLWYDLIQQEFRNLFSETAQRTPTTIASLRTLLQRGLRLHPTAVPLWLYSLQVELQHIQTRSAWTKDDVNDTPPENDDALPKYYALMTVMYDHACQSLQNDAPRLWQFHTQCIDLLYEYENPPHTDAMVQHIVNTVEKFGSSDRGRHPSPLWYILRATLAVPRKPTSSSAHAPTVEEADDAVFQILQEACQAIPTSDMMVTALQFLRHHCLRPAHDHATAQADRVRNRIDALYRSFRTPHTQSESDVAPVVYEYIQYLRQDAGDEDRVECHRRALEIVKDFVELNATNRGAIPSYLWIQYAALTYGDSSSSHGGSDASRCIPILQQALQCLPMHQQPDYSNILEQLFCVYIHCRTDEANEMSPVSDAAILKLLDEIVLFSPGRSSLLPPNGTQQRTWLESSPRSKSPSPSTGIVSTIPNLPSACYRYVLYLIDQLQKQSTDSHSKKTTEQLFRKVCDKVLLDSNVLFQWLDDHKKFSQESSTDLEMNRSTIGTKEVTNESSVLVIVQQLLDVVLEVEVDYLRAIRLYDRAIRLFQIHVPSWVQFYQEQKAEILPYHSTDPFGTRGKTVANKRRKLITISPGSLDNNDRTELFTSVPVLDFTDASASSDTLTHLYNKYQVLHVKKPSTVSPAEFSWEDIGPLFDLLNEADQATFCIETATDVANETIQAKSFLSSHATKTKDRAYCSFLLQKSKELYNDTIQKLPFQDFPHTDWTYEPTVWFFFGRNFIGSTNLDGRSEHTDSVSHDGTWHYQLSGSKRWFIRPTTELLNRLQLPHLTASTEWCVDCKRGDVLIINTRLWFHRTIIPPQRMPSVSYARDFRFGDSTTSCTMTNVDGLYATEDISKGTIIFTETDMPDCELHRSSIDPNCEVVALEDGTSAVMSIRPIKAGEFFCVPESSDEDDSEAHDSDSASFHSME